jgi:hypothetical protein
LAAFLAARFAGAFLAADLRAVVFFATATLPPVVRSLPPSRALWVPLLQICDPFRDKDAIYGVGVSQWALSHLSC